MKSGIFLILLTNLLFISSSCVSKRKGNIPVEKLKTGNLGDGQFFIDCNLGELKTQCQIDTGANSNSVIANKVAKKYKSVSRSKEKTASGHEVICDEVIIPKVQSQGMVLKSDAQFSRCEGKTKNVVGFPFFDKEMVDFYFRDGFIRFLTANEGLKKKSFELSREPYGHLSIPVRFGEKRLVKGIWDTGAGLTGCSQEFIEANPSLFKFRKKINNGVDPYGKKVSMDLYVAKNMSLGTEKLDDVNIISMDFKHIRPYFSKELQCFIGFNTIEKMNWTFDFNANRFSVRR